MKKPLIMTGINHNGDLELAKKLILLAKKQFVVLSLKKRYPFSLYQTAAKKFMRKHSIIKRTWLKRRI